MYDEHLGETDGSSDPVSSDRKSVWARVQAVLGTYRSAITSIIFFSLVAWLAFNWFQTVERILHCYSGVPFEDYWRVALNVPRYKAMDFRVLWVQHNEHRILFPEIIFALDMLTWHGRQILTLAVSFLCYLSTWLVLAWTLFSDRRFPSPVQTVAVLLAGIAVGWKGSAIVLADPFLLQWTLMELCVFLSLAFLVRVKEGRANVYLILAIISGVLATYSSSNALLLWPLLLAAGMLLRFTKREMTILGIAACASVGFYFVGYHFLNHVNIGNLVSHPFYLVGYVGAYLSMPFGGMKSPQFGTYVGLISLSIVIVLFVFAARNRLLVSKPGIVLFGAYSFTLLTALMTAAGRMDPADPGFTSAKAERYLSIPLMSWGVFISLALWIASRCRWKIVSPVVITLLVIILMAIGFLKLKWWVQGGNNMFADEQLAALGFEDGLTDPGLIRKIFPDPSLVFRCLPELRKDNLSFFYRSRQKWLGVPVDRFSRVLATPASGEVAYTFPVRSGFEVVGWADLSSRGAQYNWVVLTNELGLIAGFGERLPAGFPAELHSPHAPPSLAWAGFVNLNVKTRSFSIYVVDPRRKGLFPIPGSLPVPTIEAAGLENLGLRIPGVDWERDAAWTLDGYPPPSRFDAPPPNPIYSSWSGNDANTGQMVSSIFPAPANRCMILPVLHGPSVEGQSAQIEDADTGKLVESIPMQDADLQWEFWRVPLDVGVKRLRVSARDQGRNYGQWTALGSPSECR